MLKKVILILKAKLKIWTLSLIKLKDRVYISPSVSFVSSDKYSLKFNENISVKEKATFNINAGNIYIDDNVWINKNCEFNAMENIKIGSGTSFQKNCTINGNVTIGRHVIFAPNIFISSGSHLYSKVPFMPIRLQEMIYPGSLDEDSHLPVIIGDDVWLGINVVVMPGITVSKGSIVGSNAVITRNTKPYSINAGVPSEQIGTRLEVIPPKYIDFTNSSSYQYIISSIKLDEEKFRNGELSFELLENSFKIFIEVGNSQIAIKLSCTLKETSLIGKVIFNERPKELVVGENSFEWTLENELDSSVVELFFTTELLPYIVLSSIELICE